MSQNLIKEALNQACIHIREGCNPTDSLEKVAEAHDLNAHYTQRVGELLNVALNYQHFKHGEDKSANFPIADIPGVISKRLKDTSVTPLKKKSEHFSFIQNQTSIPDLNRVLNDGVYKRAVLQMDEDIKKGNLNTHTPMFETVVKKANGDIEKLAREVDNTQALKISYESKFKGAFEQVLNQFTKCALARTPWHEVESQMFSKHGEEIVPYLDLIYKTAGLKEDRGIHDSKYWLFDDVKEASMIDNLLDTGHKLVELETKLAEVSEKLKSEKEYLRTIWKEASTHNTVKSEVIPGIGGSSPVAEVVKKKAEDLSVETVDESAKKFAFNLLDMITDRIQDSINSKEDKKNPFKNEASDNTQRKIILQELMMIDPIISKAPPTKVRAAYEQLIKIAPELSTQKEIVRSALREMLASQALNPHTSNLLTEADLNIMRSKLIRSAGHQSGQGGK